MEGNGKLWRKDGEIEAAWDLPAGYMLGRAVYKVRRRVTFWEGKFYRDSNFIHSSNDNRYRCRRARLTGCFLRAC